MKIVTLFAVVLIGFTSCKKHKNEKQFTGTYIGEWQNETIQEGIDSSGAYTLSELETSSGEFTITRDEEYALLNVSSASSSQKVKLKDLDVNEIFTYYSPIAPMGVANNSSSWALQFTEDSLIWTSKNHSQSDMYRSTTNIKRFSGVK